MTNFERIKAMSVEQMVKALNADISALYCKNLAKCVILLETSIIPDDMCEECIRTWLESEVQDEAVCEAEGEKEGA